MFFKELEKREETVHIEKEEEKRKKIRMMPEHRYVAVVRGTL